MLANLLAATERTSADMTPQQVSKTLWALAKLGMPLQGTLCGSMLAASECTSTAMSPQDVANTLWAMATLGLPLQGRLRASMLAAAERTSAGMKPQEVAYALWAMAKLGSSLESALHEALLAALQRTLPSMTERTVANAAWAHAQLQVAVPEPALAAINAAVLESSSSSSIAPEQAAMVMHTYGMWLGQAPAPAVSTLAPALAAAEPSFVCNASAAGQLVLACEEQQGNISVTTQEAICAHAAHAAPCMPATLRAATAAALQLLRWPGGEAALAGLQPAAAAVQLAAPAKLGASR